MLEMISSTLFTVAEESINAVLRNDPTSLQRLSQLEGKTLVIQLTQPDMRFAILPNADGLQLHSKMGLDADVTLTGTPADFMRLLSSPDKAAAMFGQGISASGDNGLATELQHILSASHFDWEGKLAAIIGNLPAHQLADFISFKSNQYRTIGNSLLENLQEYLKEESDLLPARPEVDDFLNAVDRLRDDADRLEARFQRLSEQVNHDR
ncbi:MAG: SCP2 sterol-binding domain-containing protein [Marinobacterium sp.]|nr:SCP2 sterol-binding domain-containing protein [Marinobacterium sp.]